MERRGTNKPFIGANQKESLYDLALPEDWNGKLIVFIHGYMGYKDWGCWNLVSDFFVSNHYGFLKYNVSHNGVTASNPTSFDDLEAFSINSYAKEVADCDAILEQIKTDFSLLPDIYLIGHSRGGGIALLESTHPLVKKIATWAAISSIGDRFPSGSDLAAWKNEGYYYRQNARTHQEMPHHYVQYEEFLMHEDRLDIEAHCRDSKKPTLIIHGSGDTSVPIAEGKKLAEWLNVPLTIIPNANHTFGSAEPWTQGELPSDLLTVCKHTLAFFDQEKNTVPGAKKMEDLSLLYELIQLSKSDQELHGSERQFLEKLANLMGVSAMEFEQLFDQYIAFSPPKDEWQRILQFQRLVLLMNVDLAVESEELQFIKSSGLQLGLHPLAIGEVLKKMRQKEKGMIPPSELIAIFRTHHN